MAEPSRSRLLKPDRRWPWPREVYGLILERLLRAGAKVVIFDLTFPTSTENDEPFRLALDRPASELLNDPNLNRLFLGGHVKSAA